MVSGVILRKLDEHTDLVNNILNKCLKQIKNIIQPVKDVSKIKHIKTPHSDFEISSLCLLKDKRLVSAGGDGLVIVYDHSHEPQIQIKNPHTILSLCVVLVRLVILYFDGERL